MSKYTDLDEHILHIVENFAIYEQIDLQSQLQNIGYNIPQATLSRRLKKLKIVKLDGRYKIVELNMLQALPRVLNLEVSDFGMIVLHTYPGNANSLAYFLDQNYVSFSPSTNEESLILGTIAGDDTVLIIAKSKAAISKIIKMLQQHFTYLAS